jgi:hypothetical protein
MHLGHLSIPAEVGRGPNSLPILDDRVPARPKKSPESAKNIRNASRLHRLFSFPAMLGMILVGRVFYEARSFTVDPDLWWHIKVGQNILATHSWPTTDSFSHSVAGTPWLAYEWLGDVLLGAVERLAGLQGLLLLLVVLGSAIVLALYSYAAMRSGNSKAAFLASLVLCSLAFASFNLRPQMLGYLFIILLLIVLERFRQGNQNALWFIPLLFLVWINAHGSWVIGLGVFFLFWITGCFAFRWGNLETNRWTPKERLSISTVFLFSIAAIPITPYGGQLAAYPFTVATTLPLNVENVMEWQSMPFHLAGGKIFLCLLLGMLVLQVISRFTWRLEEFLLLLFGTWMACLHVRFLLLFVPFFAPLFATMLARWIPSYDRQKDLRIVNASIMAGALAAMVHFFPSQQEMRGIVARTFPAQAVDYMRSHPVPGSLYNTYGFGGYLVWALPQQKVFIDGRGDLYEVGGVFAEYLEVAALKPAAFSVLKAHGIHSCLLERKEALATVLGQLPEWHEVYSDPVSVLFVRRNEVPNEIAVAGKADFLGEE